MSKGLAMSAILLALSSNASASLVEATQATTTLRSSGVQGRSALNCDALDYVLAINEASKVINQETQKWRDIYAEIDSSAAPELFFDETNMKQLNDADLFVRSGEEMLRIQVENLMAEHQNEIPDHTLAAIRNLRVSIAKLRMSVTNVLNIEKQLRPAIASNKASFDMSADAVQSLKTATENAYYH
ncbi:hypothetical protein CGK32_19665 [Vibrio parahaemolyticus]|nr:hypothetical protein CGK32_19665 [Vibrio parahaemolyticus]